VDTRPRPAPEAFRELLERTRLPEPEVAARVEQALSPAYWARLNPGLSVGQRDATPGAMETAPIADEQQARLVARWAREGYLRIPSLLSGPALDRMREAVEVLRREDWPASFAFVYDQFWLVPRAPSLVRLLSALLGVGYRQTADLWAYYVPARHAAGGWPPHQDYPGQPGRLSVWIPLTEVTIDDSYVSVIPRDAVPVGLAEAWRDMTAIERGDVGTLLKSSRALPAPVGAVLCWDGRVIHWGAASGPDGGTRISLGMGFIGEGGDPAGWEHPLFDPQAGLPAVAERLRVIGQTILEYRRNEPLMIRYEALARRIVDRAGAR